MLWAVESLRLPISAIFRPEWPFLKYRMTNYDVPLSKMHLITIWLAKIIWNLIFIISPQMTAKEKTKTVSLFEVWCDRQSSQNWRVEISFDCSFYWIWSFSLVSVVDSYLRSWINTISVSFKNIFEHKFIFFKYLILCRNRTHLNRSCWYNGSHHCKYICMCVEPLQPAEERKQKRKKLKKMRE